MYHTHSNTKLALKLQLPSKNCAISSALNVLQRVSPHVGSFSYQACHFKSDIYPETQCTWQLSRSVSIVMLGSSSGGYCTEIFRGGGCLTKLVYPHVQGMRRLTLEVWLKVESRLSEWRQGGLQGQNWFFRWEWVELYLKELPHSWKEHWRKKQK